jgi:hypothetical protein
VRAKEPTQISRVPVSLDMKANTLRDTLGVSKNMAFNILSDDSEIIDIKRKRKPRSREETIDIMFKKTFTRRL